MNNTKITLLATLASNTLLTAANNFFTGTTVTYGGTYHRTVTGGNYDNTSGTLAVTDSLN